MGRIKVDLGKLSTQARNRAQEMGLSLSGYIRLCVAQNLNVEHEPQEWGSVPCKGRTRFTITDKMKSRWDEMFPRLNIGEELSKYCRWDEQYLYSKGRVESALESLFERRDERLAKGPVPVGEHLKASSQRYKQRWQGWLHAQCREAQAAGESMEDIERYQEMHREPGPDFTSYREWRDDELRAMG